MQSFFGGSKFFGAGLGISLRVGLEPRDFYWEFVLLLMHGKGHIGAIKSNIRTNVVLVLSSTSQVSLSFHPTTPQPSGHPNPNPNPKKINSNPYPIIYRTTLPQTHHPIPYLTPHRSILKTPASKTFLLFLVQKSGYNIQCLDVKKKRSKITRINKIYFSYPDIYFQFPSHPPKSYHKFS